MAAATALARVAAAAARAVAARGRRAAANANAKPSLVCAILILAVLAATSLKALVRESDVAAHAREEHHAAAYHQQQQQQLLESELAALGGRSARVAVDPPALLAARECGDPSLASLARDLERIITSSRNPWPLAVARAQMRAALDLASAGLMARAAADAEAQDAAEALDVEQRVAEAEQAVRESQRDSGTARRRRRKADRKAKPSLPPPPPKNPALYRRLAREHKRGWQFALRTAQLLAERAAVGSLAPIPCGDGGTGDVTLPGLTAGAALLALTMARDVDSGERGRDPASAPSSAAASARNAAWQAVRLAAGTPHGRLAVSLAVLLDEQEAADQRKKDIGKRGGATAAAEAAAKAQAAERAQHLRSAAALLRMALAPLGVECRASELTPSPPSSGAATAAATAARNATAAERVAAMAAALEVGAGSGQPQAPFVGRGAALARNAAVDAYFFFGGGGKGTKTTTTKKKGPNASSSFAPDSVLFADARAFFCAEDALRLLSYPPMAVDLACALPLVEDPLLPSESPNGGGDSAPLALMSSASLFAEPNNAPATDNALAEAAARAHPDVPSRLRLRSLRADAAADAARDVRGSALAPLPPFLVHADSAALARQGQPVPVRCCWGGLARVAAWPFRRGVRFRAGGGGAASDGACAQPYHEASVLCGDLHRLGARGAVTNGTQTGTTTTTTSGGRGPARVVLDPAVRTSPQARVRRALAHRRFPYYYYTRMEAQGSWRADVEPLIRRRRTGAGGGGAGGERGDESMVFWPPPGRPAVGGMWQPTMRRVACCEAPFRGGGGGGGALLQQQRPSLAGDCRPVAAGEGGGGGGGGRNETRAFFDACASTKGGDSDASVRIFCPGAALESARARG